MRMAGALIWATRFEETVTRERQGGKGGGPKVERYRLPCQFRARDLRGTDCRDPPGLGRWPGTRSRKLDMRIYRGTATQLPDPLIEAKQGTGRAPAWRGLAYVVFERLPLDDFGNRIPAFQFEVVRPVGKLEAGNRGGGADPRFDRTWLCDDAGARVPWRGCRTH
jgi:hypothetical protein